MVKFAIWSLKFTGMKIEPLVSSSVLFRDTFRGFVGAITSRTRCITCTWIDLFLIKLLYFTLSRTYFTALNKFSKFCDFIFWDPARIIELHPEWGGLLYLSLTWLMGVCKTCCTTQQRDGFKRGQCYCRHLLKFIGTARTISTCLLICYACIGIFSCNMMK